MNASGNGATPQISTGESVWIVAISLPLLAFCTLTTIGAFRLCRWRAPFVMFTSQGVLDIYLLLSIAQPYVDQLLGWSRVNDSTLSRWAMISGHLHNMLIAANRASAMLFPLQYERWWPSWVVLSLVLAAWILSGALTAVVFIWKYDVK